MRRESFHSCIYLFVYFLIRWDYEMRQHSGHLLGDISGNAASYTLEGGSFLHPSDRTSCDACPVSCGDDEILSKDFISCVLLRGWQSIVCYLCPFIRWKKKGGGANSSEGKNKSSWEHVLWHQFAMFAESKLPYLPFPEKKPSFCSQWVLEITWEISVYLVCTRMFTMNANLFTLCAQIILDQ